MNDDIEEIRERIQRRKHTISPQGNKPLNDKNFKSMYNFVIKSMIMILIGLSIVTYLKVNPDTNIKEYILNDTYYKTTMNWISRTVMGFLPQVNKSLPVHSNVLYTRVEGNHFKNNSNEVVNFDKGKVIYTGQKKGLGLYLVVLLDNGVQVTYAGLKDISVSLYDTVKKGMIVGTYDKELTLLFEYLGEEISYEAYLRME